ncbi:MAG: Pls/PosA family non-ribosomal peptide synthetase [Gammaproteobacteria bacterium]
MELLQEYFERQADTHPERIALICHGTLLTYKDIENRSNQMAHWLRSKGVGEGHTIGILLDRTIDLYITIIAILKAGAAYVPLDPGYPQVRVEYILSTSQAKLLITTEQYSKNIKNSASKVIALENQEEIIATQSNQRLRLQTTSADLCYIIFTSGTTGWPKGVRITHGNVCNYLDSALQIYGVTADDRIYQGFSIAFDGAVEEIWLALASGATLIVGAYDAVHAGAGLGMFFKQHKVTLFSTVPTMLAMLEDDLPTLRILILGGEICPQTLIEHWARPALRIFNTYGPTETTVVATYKECDPTKAITIGKPLPNYEAIILDDNGQPVPAGVEGELCIGGLSVSQGYINNEELNQKKFIKHPLHGKRIYRTGDLAYFTEDGEIQYVGRMDDQIKLRGYRIELSGLESALKEYPGIRDAAVVVCQLTPGVKSLVAYLAPKNNAVIDKQKVAEYMHSRYPDYMIPALFEIIPTLPLLPSGKVDRKNLAEPKIHFDKIKADYFPPQTQIEKMLTKTWEDLFKHKPISIKADFFHELGGHSLLAAKVISILRKNESMNHLSTLDLYECPTIETLAKRISDVSLDMQENNVTDAMTDTLSRERYSRYFLCSIAQIVGISLQSALSSWQFLIAFLAINWSIETAALFSLQFFAVIGAIFLFLEPTLFIIVILAKWLLLGRIKPGEYKLWGWFYLRWWMVEQLAGLLPTSSIVGSPFIILYYRLMGAKIGKNCYISSDSIYGFDLFSMDDNSSIGADVIIQNYTIKNGRLKIGYSKIGKRCYIGANSVLDINTTLCDDAKLGEHSTTSEGMTLHKNQSYAGTPAKPCEISIPTVPATAKTPLTKISKLRQLFSFITQSLVYTLGLFLIQFVYVLAIIPGIVLIDYFCFFHSRLIHLFWIIPVSTIAFITILCVCVILLKKLIIGKVQAGTYKIQSFYYIRKWFVERLIDLTVDSMQALYATVYSAGWYKLLGANIGKRTELSTVTYSFPDLLNIGEESFIADGVMLGAPRVYCGYAQIGPVTLGKRSFIGNSAIVPINSELGDNCLIGCLSIPPNINPLPANTSWFGSPSILLPRREVMGSFPEAETYMPPLRLVIARGLVDLLKIVSPLLLFFSMLALEFITIGYLLNHFAWLNVFALFALADIAIALGIVNFVIALKWILIGRYTSTAKAAWNPSVWISEYITGLYDSVAVPAFLDKLLGTPFYAFFLRLLGAKIGSRVYIGTTYFSEFDLIEIGNDVSLNSEATIQTHLFEDRIMKMANLRIENACTLGLRSIILYDAVMERHSYLANLSLLMKGEILPAYTSWAGIPAQYFKKKSISAAIVEEI